MLKDLIRPPFAYIGAKTKLLQWIYQFFPDHVTFVDVFGGTGVVTFNKIPSKNDVYNDINGRIVNFYSVLRDEYSRQILQDLIALTPYSRLEFQNCKEPVDDPIEDARRFYVRQNQSFSGKNDGFGIKKDETGSSIKTRFYKKIDDDIFERLENITFESLSFEKMFETYDQETTLFYCDPPYIESLDYKTLSINYTKDDHKRLIECLLNLKGFAIMSNYENELNKPLLDAGWHLEKKDFFCCLSNNDSSVGRESTRTECLYLSPRVMEQQNRLF